MNLRARLKIMNRCPPEELFRAAIEKITRHTVLIRKFYLLTYDGRPKAGNGRGPGIVRVGTPSDVPAMAELEDPGKRKIFQERFAAGEHCVVAEHNGKIVGYEWYSSGTRHIEQRYNYAIPIPADAVYAYDAFIAPEYRISGIWIRFKDHLGRDMAELDKSRIITLIDSGNRISLGTHTRFGYRIFRRIILVSIAGKTCFSEKDVSRSVFGRDPEPAAGKRENDSSRAK